MRPDSIKASPKAARKTRDGRQRRHAGFTLIELMVVMVLIGILSAMIIPEMRGTYQDALLRTAGREWVSLCNLASSRAISLNQPHRVRFDPRTGKYRLERRAEDSEAPDGYVPVRDVSGAAGAISTRIAIRIQALVEAPSADPLNEPGPEPPSPQAPPTATDALTFYPDGTADAREIWLRDEAGFVLRLRINSTTARVTLLQPERE